MEMSEKNGVEIDFDEENPPFRLSISKIAPEYVPSEIVEELIENAKNRFEEARNNNLFRGRPPNEVFTASIYIELQRADIPINPKDITKLFNDISRQDLFSAKRFLVSKLDIDLAPSSPRPHAERFCTELGLPEPATEIAVDIVEYSQESDEINGSAAGIAAGAVYAASVIYGCDDITQSEIATISGKSEVTIRNWYPQQIELYESRLTTDGHD